MIRAAAIGFGAALLLCGPLPVIAAEETSCAASKGGAAMAGCLLDRAGALIAQPGFAEDPETLVRYQDWLIRVAGEAGDTARLESLAQTATSPRLRVRALGALGTVAARSGDEAGARAALDTLSNDPSLAPLASKARADILAAWGGQQRFADYLDPLQGRAKAIAFLDLADALTAAGKEKAAARLVTAQAGKVPAGEAPIIVYSDTAIALAEAGHVDAARQLGAVLTEVDRDRIDARIALALDGQGKRGEARSLLADLLKRAPRSTDARLASALIAARQGEWQAMMAAFPKALAYDQALLARFWPLLVDAGKADLAASLIAAMNNGKDRAAAHARMAVLLAEAGRKEAAASFLEKALAILNPLVNLPRGAAPQLIDFGPALAATVEALAALDRAGEARDLIRRLEKAVQTDPYGLARPGIMRGLILTNEALFAHLLKAGEDAAVTGAATTHWRRTAARDALLKAGRTAEAVRLAEQRETALGKTGDFLAIAQYISEH